MRRLLSFLFVIMACASCEEAPIEELQGGTHGDRSLNVEFDDESTRIQLQEGLTVWNEGDLLSVFYRSSVNEQWQFMGETGDRNGEITPVDNTIVPPVTNSRIVVVYPYNESYFYNSDSGNIEATLSAVQSYREGSYGINGNIMISSNEFNQVSLKSVCGWLKLQLTGNGERVKSITLSGNSGEQVAGIIYVNSTDATATLATAAGDAGDNEVGGTLIRPGTILTEVTLDCGEGVTLGAEPTAFYIALPPQTFAEGLSVSIRDIDGYLMTQSTTSEVVIERNHIQPMKEFAFSGIVPTNELYYIATHKLNPRSNDWGANIVSHVWNEATGEGVITFDGEITEIGNYAFSYGQTAAWLKSITIPSSVKVIGEGAFSGMSITQGVFERVIFAKNSKLEKVKDGAFRLNPVLKSITLPQSVTEIGDGICLGCGALEGVYLNNDHYSTLHFGRATVLYKHIGDNRVQIVVFPAVFPQSSTMMNMLAGATTIGYGAISMFNIKSFYWHWIESIDSYNFAMCNEMTTISLDRVKTIGDYVLYMCDKLISINLPMAKMIGEECFTDNNELQSINLGCDELATINRMGNDCPSLQSIKIPAGVTSISSSFNNCAAINEIFVKAVEPPMLTESFNAVVTPMIYVPAESVDAYRYTDGWSAFANYIVGYDFENGVIVEISKPSNNEIWYTATAQVEESSFYPWSYDTFGANITSHEYDSSTGKGIITFESDITTIGEMAFYDCDRLTSVTIPDSVTTIGGSAFWYCNNLTSITIPDSVTTIGEAAFWGCSSLTSVNIPDSVTTIGEAAFWGCSSLTSVTIPDSVTTIGEAAFAVCSGITEFIGKFAEDNGRILVVDGTLVAFAPACGATEYTIPDSVTTIGNSAFWYCNNLTSITIPDSVTTIGGSAFLECSNLTSVTIPDGVTTIGDWAFSYCSSLTSVNIPDSVTTIGEAAFANCTSLTSVYCKPTTPPTGGYDMFYDNASGRKIYVPTESVDAYKSAEYWNEYADDIVGYDF